MADLQCSTVAISSLCFLAAIVAAFAEFISLFNDNLQAVGHETVWQVTKI